MAPDLLKMVYCLRCLGAPSSGLCFSCLLITTCQNPWSTQTPGYLILTVYFIGTFWQVKTQPSLIQEDLSALETVKWTSTSRQNYIHGHILEVVDSSKCLGVTISEDLTWRRHVESTVNKANKTLGFIQRNLGDCTVAVKSAACTRGYEQQIVKKEEIRLGFQGGKAPRAKWI